MDVTGLRSARDIAARTAWSVGVTVRERVSGAREIQFKGEVDLVTDADREAEEMIAAALRDAYPDFRLSGEEGAEGALASDYGWLIDPIDGTTNFAHGYPHFAVSICLEYRGEPVVGAIHDPMRDELFVGAKGLGATLNGRPISVSTVGDVRQALLATGFSYDIANRGEQAALWLFFNDAVQGARRDGAAALNMAWVAAGRLDAYYEKPVNAWDIGAGVVIAREAGATVSSMDGGDFVLDANEVVCTNGVIHEVVTAGISDVLRNFRAT